MARALLVAILCSAAAAAASAPDGWSANAQREEIRPAFSFDRGVFGITTDARDGLDGFWRKTYSVEGGKYYRFSGYGRTSGTIASEQCAVVTVQWLDASGKRVLDDRKLVEGYLMQYKPTTPLEYATRGSVSSDGWNELKGLWQAPAQASQAVIELHGRWAANAKMEWKEIQFGVTEPPAPRMARLASIHLRPQAGRTPREKREQFAALIAEAGRRKADLVVLPETLTYYNSGATPAEVAEPIPGDSTRYFAALAKEHHLYIVAGLFEKDAYKVYNVAVLLTPDGELAGKYRKVTLPDSEASAGVVPGNEYPIFQTRFGKLGIMVCYDGFFPEVARELTLRGAEVIAWPVWGANPDLARARAAENQVYLVSSTYEDISSNWMYTAVWDHAGRMLAQAKDWGSVIIAEVDLNSTTRWRSLGDFHSKISHHVPLSVNTK